MKNIWISGSINSGKSTLSKLLGKELKMAVIELDTFSSFVETFLSFEEYLKLNYEIFSEIVDIYNKRNIGVIIVYPLGEKRYLEIKDHLNDFLLYTLDPSLEIALTNRGGRELNDWEKERIENQYKNNVHNPSFATKINTKNKTPEETLKEILATLQCAH